eukprot:CAMPEP_0173446888 /NCGR_PEP_ID=MMETSP1357-20121228/37552_1 /TAXON_ID=77926 /ORGANISM="Hemiselmis rufescens, Strain PCC563" /LENGTH=137 /DNA_ID=CAMNT_0014413231 /DNA_START=18 /DNA_END=428 /DNA_ORIENTATION=-
MEDEHCRSRDSEGTFAPVNRSNTPTTPSAEWGVVTDQKKGWVVSDGIARRVRVWGDVLQDAVSKRAGLVKEEVIALQLYTGPMYGKYNAVLRGTPPEVVKALRGNTYACTISCIVSGIKKLSQVMRLPTSRRLWVGV